MIRQIESAQLTAAAVTVRDTLPLAGVLGRLCTIVRERAAAAGPRTRLPRFGTWSDSSPITTPSKPRRASCPAPPATGRKVAIVGAGPTGLAAAFFLARKGHGRRAVDRNAQAGGSLRREPETALLPQVLATEVARLLALGIRFTPGAELGRTHDLATLRASHDAVVLTVGELADAEKAALGIASASTGLKADPNTCETEQPGVFAAGAAVKPVKQLVRAMAEGRAVAECVGQFLRGARVRRPTSLSAASWGGWSRVSCVCFSRQHRSAARRGVQRVRRGLSREAPRASVALPALRLTARRAIACCSTTRRGIRPTPAASARSAGRSSSNGSRAA